MNKVVENYQDPVIEMYKRDVDRTLIRQNLRLTVEQRIEKLMQLQKFAEELRSNRKHHSDNVYKLR